MTIYFKENIQSKISWKKLASLVGLGTLGSENDLPFLEEFAHSDNSKIRFIALKAIIALTKTTQQYSTLIRILSSNIYTNFYLDLQYLVDDFDNLLLPGLSVKILFSLQTKTDYRPHRTKVLLRIIAKLITPNNYYVVQEFIKNIFHDNHRSAEDYEELFELGLDVGCNFQFFINIIRETNYSLTFQYHTYMHEKIANLADDFDYISIRNFFNDTSARHNWDLNNYANDYLMLWIMACAFSKLVRHNDKPILIRIMEHNFWTVQNAAIRGLEKISDETDIDFLLTLSLKNKKDSFIKALRILDKKFYYKNDVKRFLNNHIIDDYYDVPF